MLTAALPFAVFALQFAGALPVTEPQSPQPSVSPIEGASIWIAGSDRARATDAQLGWDLEVSERGLRVFPLEGALGAAAQTWSFEIGTAAFGRVGAAASVTLSQPAARGERVDLDHGSLTEWFVRGEHGVEHGWTIPSAPEGDASRPLWIGLRVGGDLSMHIVDDGSGAFLRDARGELRLRYVDLHVQDAAGRALDARLSASPVGIGIRIDARGAVYPIEVDPVVTTAVWAFEMNQADAAQLPCCPAQLRADTAGDVNGDGYSDIIVGDSPYDGAAGADEGRAWVFLGHASGPSSTPDWTAFGTIAGGTFATAVGTIGDVNRDGYGDIAVTAYAHGNGKVYVWLGGQAGAGNPTGIGPNGTPANADFVYEASLPGYFGYELAALGDVDGDSYDDFGVAAQATNNWTGRAYVFFGGPSGPVAGATNPWIQDGTQVNGQFGCSIARAGDVNHDRHADLIVGEQGYNSGTGRAHVFHGGTSFRTDHTADWTQSDGGQTGQSYGIHVSGTGDFNGDGYADAAVASGNYDTSNFTDAGIVWWYRGGPVGLSNTPAVLGQADTCGGGIACASYYGNQLGSAGDVDGDGFGDVVVSSWDTLPSGGVYIVHGSPSGAYNPAGPGDQRLDAPPTEIGLGFARGAGDVNGDGFCDVLTAAPKSYSNPEPNEGAVFLRFGSANPEGNAIGGYTSLLIEPSALAPGTASSRMGRSVSSAGDVDADGFNDVIIGSPEFGATNNGRVQVFLGSRTGVNFTSAFATIDSTNVGEQFGWSVSAGDIDNDGKSDIVVGAPNYSSGQANEGRVYIFRSLGNSVSATPTWSFESDQAGALFGSAVSAVGDVNADGFNDIAVSAPGAMSSQGSVTIFHGRASSLAAITAAVTITSGIPGSEFGTALALVGDLNLDGFGDLAVGAPRVDNPQIDEGRIYVYLGSYTGISNTVAGQEESQQAGAMFGSSIAQCGDINGDGRAEILVGSPGFDAATGGGAAFLYQAQTAGAGVTMTALAIRTGAQANSQFGFAVSAGGDVNGDGWNDVLVGAPDFDGNLSNQGRIYLYLGSSTGLATSPSETYDGVLANARFGESIALGGDVNGDGLSDPIGGVPSLNGDDGAVLIFSAGGNTSWRVSSTQRQVGDLQALQILGRTSETSQFQINLGVQNSGGNTATAMGRADVKLEWEIQPVSSLLDGTNVQEQPTFVDSGSLGGGLRLFKNVTGLVNGTAYHWRARTVVRNPYYPHTRWTTIQLDGLQEKKLGLSADCNNNGIGDPLDIQSAFSFDCNGNTIPDECDITALTSLDCNADIVPDECELVLNDCNNNLIPDDCDTDCNGNFAPDECDIANSISIDSNGDLVPDECQTVSMNLAHFCFGDGTGAACPCGNSSPVGNEEGCLSSLAVGGRLRATGIARVLAPYDNFTLVGTQMPNSSALYFQGTAQQSSGNGSAFGDGKRCASGSILRLGTKISAGNTSQYPELGDQPISIRGSIPAPGGTRYYQGWYRNAAAFCTANTFNLTNGLRVTWIP